MRKLVVLAGALLLLTGCSSAAPEVEAVDSVVEEPATNTTAQYASVISRHLESWESASDDAVGCRLTWTMTPGTLEGMSCYLKESTAQINAELALREFGAMTPPDEIAKLVSETEGRLTYLTEIPLKEICGDASVGEPAATPECNTTLGELNSGWTLLGTTLSAWGPYL